jgi:hypothetical protein
MVRTVETLECAPPDLADDEHRRSLRGLGQHEVWLVREDPLSALLIFTRLTRLAATQPISDACGITVTYAYAPLCSDEFHAVRSVSLARQGRERLLRR